MEIRNSRLRRQLDLALGMLDGLEPDLKPGVDFAACLQAEIRKIRGAGSRDRRFYREIIYTWLRYREWIDPFRKADAEVAAVLLVFLAGETRELQPAKVELPGPLRKSTRASADDLARLLTSFVPETKFEVDALVPDWLPREFPSGSNRVPHTLDRPPIWIRSVLNRARETTASLESLGISVSVHPDVPGALSIPTDTHLEGTEAYKAGCFEIQDIGSQAILHQVDPTAGEHWFDACAGAGGKSLQLAEQVGATGQVTATDKRSSVLNKLRARAGKAGHGNLIILEPRNAEASELLYDGVLVDAPCSGSGTWRRRPFLRHQTDPEVIKGFTQTQIEILNLASDRVLPGGRLVYATCSLCRSENEEVVGEFLRNHPDFQPDPTPNRLNLSQTDPGQFLILPERFNGDAFFLATLRRSQTCGERMKC
jgi:16S rRNA (cytosine967-C5)-methyltransferase